MVGHILFYFTSVYISLTKKNPLQVPKLVKFIIDKSGVADMRFNEAGWLDE